jgi:pimeloyl-ACP methyl ester carboxylesterase
MRLGRLVILGSLLVATLGGGRMLVSTRFAAGATAASPPGQPVNGPGGAAVTYPAVIATRHGDAPTGYWLFEPATAAGSPTSDPQPLVVFLHGFGALNPRAYRAWIDHIVERGAVVVYPDYQTPSVRDARPVTYLDNVVTAVQGALTQLALPGHTPIDLTRVAVVGHSEGGFLAANYAALADAKGAPVPGALMSVEPGGCRGCGKAPQRIGPPLADLGQISAGTLALVLVGQDDDLAAQDAAVPIWHGMTSVPLDHRDYVLVQSDDHGSPPLVANHFFPVTGAVAGAVDALDWYGTWRLFDALTDCAFAHTDCDQALGGGVRQRAMGTWSDGTPVAPLIITDDPSTL